MSTSRIKVSLFINYFVFAILLNSVGTVILQVQDNFGISESTASILEAFKDLSIAITSFLIASYVVKIGYKRSMLISLGFISIVCLMMPILPSFWMTKLLFAATGVGFALIKVSVFATIGIVTEDQQGHVSLMSFLESFFMIGVLSGYFIFSAFVDDANPQSTQWFQVYYVLAALSAIAFLLLWSSSLDESKIKNESQKKTLVTDFLEMLALIGRPIVLIFIICAFLYVLIEQGIMSWLPTFNSRFLNLPASLSIQMASILAASTALGRFVAGFISKYMNWFTLLSICLLAAAVLVLISLPLASNLDEREITGWLDAPLAAYVFPLIGFCLAPIYPTINSVILSALPKIKHAPMSGLIVVFSALGGTTGSILTGYLFEHYGGQQAFYLSLIPITVIMFALFLFKKSTDALQAI